MATRTDVMLDAREGPEKRAGTQLYSVSCLPCCKTPQPTPPSGMDRKSAGAPGARDARLGLLEPGELDELQDLHVPREEHLKTPKATRDGFQKNPT